jgi:hypothetical protein
MRGHDGSSNLITAESLISRRRFHSAGKRKDFNDAG